MPPGLPSQFLARAAAIIAGLTLLLLVGVHGAVFYAAWALIALALLSEILATVVYWRRSPAPSPHRNEPGGI
jgi:O-antigen/teichoic acid export membrane protein